MNKFNILVESVLKEAKIDDAIKKANLTSELAQTAKSISTQLGTKASKYADFIVKNISSDDLVELIQFFEDNLSRLQEKDINKYTAETLKAEMDKLGKSKSQQKIETSKDAPIVWESPDKTIIIRNILSWEASKKYGAGTKWCITQKDSDHHWKNYAGYKSINFYFILFTDKPDTDPLYKLAVAVNTDGSINSIYNAPDTNILEKGLALLKSSKVPMDIFKPIDFSKFTEEELIKKCTSSKITKTADGSWDVDGDITINKLLVKTGQLTVRFNKVGGSFSCSDNQLTDLKGCPQTVGGYFYCSDNQLTDLKGCPQTVGGDFYCNNNQLTDLKGCPQTVGGSFSCSYNQLTDLKGCPQTVGGGFYCHNNQLTDLKGCPQTVGGDFSCSYNQLTDLKGCPQTVGGNFDCFNNQKKFTKEDVQKVSKVRGSIYV